VRTRRAIRGRIAAAPRGELRSRARGALGLFMIEIACVECGSPNTCPSSWRGRVARVRARMTNLRSPLARYAIDRLIVIDVVELTRDEHVDHRPSTCTRARCDRCACAGAGRLRRTSRRRAESRRRGGELPVRGPHLPAIHAAPRRARRGGATWTGARGRSCRGIARRGRRRDRVDRRRITRVPERSERREDNRITTRHADATDHAQRFEHDRAAGT